MSNSNPLVSIIVVTYNSSKYVLETLESVGRQTYTNIELIITDDCSKDNTLEIVKEWIINNSAKFEKIELLKSNINTGISPNCNRGIEKATGTWLKFIAGDDILDDRCIERFVYIVNQTLSEQHFLFCNKTTFKDNIKDFSTNSIINILGNSPQKQLLKYSCEIPNISPFAFLRRDTIIDLGKFDESYLYLEDLPFFSKALKSGYSFSLVEENLVYYRISDQSISNSSTNPFQSLFFKDYYKFIKVSLIPFLVSKGLLINALHMYLRTNLNLNLKLRNTLLNFTSKMSKLERRIIYAV